MKISSIFELIGFLFSCSLIITGDINERIQNKDSNPFSIFCYWEHNIELFDIKELED